jgi:meso-butanediol dehydrogenase/(S,S)-butanediol dehydrogenase/diacetyl reductase
VTLPVAVVTGAGTGIGAAIAAALAGRGHQVVVTDVDKDRASAVAERVGGVAEVLDVTSDEQVHALTEAVTAQYGPIRSWVSNAGVSAMTSFLDTDASQLDRTIAVNLRAVFVCGQAAARAMIASGRGGRIVNIASMAGKQGRVPFLADYVASKFGVVGLTQAMAYELAPHGILVNCVCPGYVETAMQEREIGWEARLRGTGPDEVRAAYIADTPLGRLEQPDDVARAVAFLLGPDAGFITGEALAVNGGAFMD